MFLQARDKEDDLEKDKDSKGSSGSKANKRKFFQRKQKADRRTSEPVAPSEKWENKPIIKRNSEDRILHGDKSGVEFGEYVVYR